jgi:hypothetical protein
MFLGHLGLALAAKRVAPRTSLGTLVAASLWIDLVWPLLLLAGVEVVRIVPDADPLLRLQFVHYPYTHGLFAVGIWASIFGGAYLGATEYRPGAVTVAALVLSHWFLDLVAHVPDLPVLSGERLGLGLWRSVPGTVAVELALLLGGALVYARTAAPRDRTGRVALWGLLVLVLATYASSLLGPAPPSARAVGLAGLAQWLLVAWAAWIDRHRAASRSPAAPPPATA